jgi:hypothetical protein
MTVKFWQWPLSSMTWAWRRGLYLGGGFNLVDGKPAVGVALLRPAS